MSQEGIIHTTGESGHLSKKEGKRNPPETKNAEKPRRIYKIV
jgi:hypothetical protein